MSVNEQPLRVDPTQLLESAVAHEQSADALAAARREHPDQVASFESWGPLFHEVRRASIDAVNAREAALNAQEQHHRAMAAQLRSSAAQFTAMDAENTASLTIHAD